MNNKYYKNAFEKILNLLKKKKNYDSVSILNDYIDDFNLAINENKEFYNQKIFKDIEEDFFGVYSKEETKKEELKERISNLKLLESLDETFEDFINKQENLNFEFEIKNEDLKYYKCPDYVKYYENLKKNQSFKVNPKDIFEDTYNNEIRRLKTKETEKEKNNIFNLFIKKKNAINDYFNSLKFYQEIDLNMNLKLKIETELKELKDYKLELEKDIKEFFEKNRTKKRKEWEEKIKEAKWKNPVQAYGNLKCMSGIICDECKKNGSKGKLFWVDQSENYVICNSCEKVKKLSEISSGECEAKTMLKTMSDKEYKNLKSVFLLCFILLM